MALNPRAEQIYEIASIWLNECLFEGGSLFWPGKNVWTTENIESFWQAFAENPDTGDRGFVEKWAEQLNGQSDNVHRMAVEVTAIYCLFPSSRQMGPASKRKLLNDVLAFSGDLGEIDPTRQKLFDLAIDGGGIGLTGTGYLAARPFHIGMYLAFAKTVKRSGVRAKEELDPKVILDEAFDLLFETMKYRPISTKHILLHLLWPDRFEDYASEDYKKRMSKNLSKHFDLQELDDVDETILQARKHMEANGFEPNFSMYDPEIEPLWNFKGPKKPDPPVKKPTDNSEPEPVTPTAKPTIDDLATTTFLQPDFLRDIESLLKSRKQLIFEGPPGSGKTFVAEKFARYFTGQSLTEKRNETIELVQFHQSYSYEDFMEGIRPETIDGQLHYNVKPGIFRRFAERASKNPDQKFVMIIDEINRGNVSRILGELMLLLEYRNETATLPYSQEPFEIPGNLFIIGTMNSADRSLSQIDYALRRRFYFLRFLAVEGEKAPVLQGWLQQQGFNEETQRRILETFIKLNHQLRTHLETDDMQVGHSYFMHPQIHEEKFRTNVWKYAVIPLIREYLYHHRDRDELLIGYEYESMRAIVQPIAEETNIPEDELTQGSSSEAEMP